MHWRGKVSCFHHEQAFVGMITSVYTTNDRQSAMLGWMMFGSRLGRCCWVTIEAQDARQWRAEAPWLARA